MRKVKSSLIAILFILPNLCLSTEVIDTLKIEALIHKTFNKRYDFMQSYINGEKPTRLYDIQVWTNPLLDGAFKNSDYSILDSLSMLYLESFKQLETINEYYLNYPGKIDTIILDHPTRVWLNDFTQIIEKDTFKFKSESVLYTSQFSYLISRAIHNFVQLDKYQDYKHMDSLMNIFPDFLVTDFYKRLIFNEKGMFQIRGWGCIKGTYNHYQLMQLVNKNKFRGKVSYCRSITDIDMFLMAGLAEILMANKINPELIKIDNELKIQFEEYLDFCLKLINKRLEKSKLTNIDGEKVTGLNFDLNAWIDHKDNEFGNCECDSIPTEQDKQKIKKIGWDLSHARRFVNFFNTLYYYSSTFNKPFPDNNTMVGLSNQFIYGAFNKDFEKPLFTNYIDGSNGWYRVNYHGQGFGYGPYDMSSTAIEGGFCTWSIYNSDITKLRDSLWNMLLAEDGEIKEHREKYYGRYFYKGKRTEIINYLDLNSIKSISLIQFLPTFY